MVMKMCGVSGCALLALVLAVVSAAPHMGDHNDHDHADPHHHEHLHHGPNQAHSHEGEPACHNVAPPNADFAFALYRNLNAKAAAGKNIFYSPLGISTALAMLSTGARLDTQSQLFTALGYSAANLSQTEVNKAYEHLLHMLGHGQEAQQLVIGNAMALRAGFKPLDAFMEDMRHFYSGEAFNVDFSKPTEAAAEINRFIAQKTQDKITDQVKDLDTETAMVLINYVFFRGKWEKPFDATHTHKADFHVDESTVVQVDMMKRTGRFDFYQDNNASVILLPYKSNTSMMIMLPHEGKMQELESLINKEYVHTCHDSVSRNSVDLFLPKFSISADAALDETLREMGVKDAFANNADLSGISEEVKLKVSKVSHKAVLSVDETGTEAAASTTIEIMPMSLPESLNLNRPFLVFILEHSTKSILFMGKISDPTAK
ncbi:alpha-1-antitrypsin homolog [Genypterus blacodes]|uniref:alpha-1-antitrypsin homolog n=1 Tax=Genypterus blacodes TaxID=154954 RepID=UPI003F76ED10